MKFTLRLVLKQEWQKLGIGLFYVVMEKPTQKKNEFITYWHLAFRFSHDELSAAVKEQYCEDEATIKHYIMLEVEYFEAGLKVRINNFLMGIKRDQNKTHFK